jgi:hypothetical protein
VPKPRVPLSEKIEKHITRIPESGCWIWMSTVEESGYGRVCDGKKPYYAHRVSYEQKYGNIPNGKMALHYCDVRCCVNPDHIFLGTQKENMVDKVLKNRQAKGTKHGNSKLTQSQAIEAKFGFEKPEVLAKRFGYSSAMIRQIRSGIYWKHLEKP